MRVGVSATKTTSAHYLDMCGVKDGTIPGGWLWSGTCTRNTQHTPSMCTHAHTYTCAHTSVQTHARTRVRMHARTHTRARAHTHTLTHTHTHTHTHTRTQTQNVHIHRGGPPCNPFTIYDLAGSHRGAASPDLAIACNVLRSGHRR